MSIGRISGSMLFSNLDRQGLDLQFTTNDSPLVYLDFGNFRVGINTNVLSHALTIKGDVGIDGNITTINPNQSLYITPNGNGSVIMSNVGITGDLFTQNNVAIRGFVIDGGTY